MMPASYAGHDTPLDSLRALAIYTATLDILGQCCAAWAASHAAAVSSSVDGAMHRSWDATVPRAATSDKPPSA